DETKIRNREGVRMTYQQKLEKRAKHLSVVQITSGVISVLLLATVAAAQGIVPVKETLTAVNAAADFAKDKSITQLALSVAIMSMAVGLIKDFWLWKAINDLKEEWKDRPCLLAPKKDRR
ncbi:MAG: hypothetical protein ABFD66_09195, partial [Smithella sp.]